MQTLLQSSTAKPLVFFLYDSADHVTGKTGVTPTVTISKNGGSFASPSGSVTEISNGFYKVAGNATDSNTLGMLALNATGTGCDQCTMAYEIVAYDPDAIAVGALTDKTGFSLTQAFPSNFADLSITATTGLVTINQSFPTNFADLAITATTGKVSIVQAFPAHFADLAITNATGLVSLAQAFPSNFSDLAITPTSGLVSITQAFPSNFSTLGIDGGGRIIEVSTTGQVGVVNDKTGYSLTQAFPAHFASLLINSGGTLTDERLTGAYYFATSARSVSVVMGSPVLTIFESDGTTPYIIFDYDPTTLTLTPQ